MVSGNIFSNNILSGKEEVAGGKISQLPFSKEAQASFSLWEYLQGKELHSSGYTLYSHSEGIVFFVTLTNNIIKTLCQDAALILILS